MTSQTKLKQTSIGKIPEEWEVVRLGDIIYEIKNGFASGKRDENGIVQIRMNNVTTDGQLIFDSYLKVPTPENVDEWLLKKGDFLFNNTNSYDLVGKSTIFNEAPFPCTFSNHFTRIRFKEEFVLPDIILYHFLLSWRKGYFKSVAIRHVGQSAVHTKYLLKIKIPLPPLPEQKKITKILSTIDDAIQKVDDTIAKTKRLKKGLMQELLTRGIGHERFRYSKELRCEIPEEWEVVRLGDVVEINKESRDPPKESPNDKFLYVDIESIEGGTGVIKKVKEIVGKNAPSRARRVIHHNDVIMSTVRPYLKAFALVPKEYDNQICSTGFAVLSYKNEILPSYLLYTLLSKMVIDQCNRMMVGGQYPALNQSLVAKIKLPLPPLPEQQKIAEILSTVDRKLELERKRKGKLERIKRGLMNDLLTGRKRVNVEAVSGNRGGVK